MKIAYITDIGKRDENEDCLYIPDSDALPIFIVADGMGGHKAGATASRIAVTAVAEYFEQATHSDYRITSKVAAAYANAKVYSLAQTSKSYSGMGTTLTYALFDGEKFFVTNIGDSRMYHYDGIALTQITKDHSYVAELVKSGQITRDEARYNPNKNVITRAVGTNPFVQADIFEFSWGDGDILLLCTDGLYDGATDDEIKDILMKVKDSEAACRELVACAREGGSTDNITVILLRNEFEDEYDDGYDTADDAADEEDTL